MKWNSTGEIYGEAKKRKSSRKFEKKNEFWITKVEKQHGNCKINQKGGCGDQEIEKFEESDCNAWERD